MLADQQTLALEGGEFYGSLPLVEVKQVKHCKGEALNEYQCALPFPVADLDTSLRGRAPVTDGRMLSTYKYDRWGDPVRLLANVYYTKLVNHRLNQGGQRKPRKSYAEALECLFANFIRNRGHRYWVRVPRDKSTRQQNGIGVKALIELVDWLASIGHIDYRPGWVGAKGANGSGIMSVVRPVGCLMSDLRQLAGDCVGTRQTRPVIALRTDDKTEIPEEKWSKYDHERRPREAMQRLLNQLNQQWGRVIVSLDGELFEQCYFRAIFSQSFLLGGRIYESSIQNLPQRDRQRLLFDDRPVTEVDYSGCQWRIMYALAGLTFAEDVDPYCLPGFTRDAVKAAAQPLGFSRSIDAAITSLKAKQNPAVKGIKDQAGNELFEPRLIGVDVDALAAAFLSKHSGIAHLLCTPNHALKMQREDAKLMADILRVMMKRKALAYPVHDSLITTTQHRELAVLTMRECFKKRYGFNCPVDVKY
jgi:hypothetical protein